MMAVNIFGNKIKLNSTQYTRGGKRGGKESEGGGGAGGGRIDTLLGGVNTFLA
jgi:hypothetical protein